MAPGTVIGSCSPIFYDPVSGKVEFIHDPKYLNALAGLIGETAKLHGRNETLARMFVYNNTNIGAEDALKYHVIEVVASSEAELLDKLRRGVTYTFAGKKYTLKIPENAEIVRFTGGLSTQIILFLSNPQLASLLLTIGVMALVLGLYAGGEPITIAIGLICIVLAMLGMGGLEVNAAAIALIILGLIFFIVEAKTGHGIAATVGVAAMLLGSLLPIQPYTNPRKWTFPPEWFQSFRITSIAATTTLACFFAFVAYKAIKARLQKPRIGAEQLIGLEGVAKTRLTPEGQVRVRGEYWKALSVNGYIEKGEEIVVVGRKGFTLLVKRKKP